jgi:hypothetical protein
MAVTLIQGIVTHLERDASSISFRIRKHALRISTPQPDLFLLENGIFVQLLADTDGFPEALDVLALKCERHPPIYLGPRMGWWCALTAIAVAAAAFVSHHETLLALPGLLGIAQVYFLMRRARVFESFTSELAELRNAHVG